MGIKPFDIRNIGRTGIINPEQIGYQDSLDIISEELHRTRRSFVKIGWYLKHIREKEMYKAENYANIYELAADKFNLSQPTATRFMNICVQFSINHDSPELDEQYIEFSMSQLFEMLPMKQDEMNQITPDMTVTQIRDFKKKGRKPPENENEAIPGQTSIQQDFPKFMPDGYAEKEIVDGNYREVVQEETAVSQAEVGKQSYTEKNEARKKDSKQEKETGREEVLSAYGLPKTVYPKGSLLESEGCGNKYYCFSCAMDGCDIRQKSRYCCEAPFGSPFACKMVDVLDDIRWDRNMKDRCPFLNDRLASHKAGNGEADPCCKECREVCDYRCARSLKSIANEKKKEEEIGQLKMPKLKNTDQRKEWLKNYKEWGLWYRDENIDVNYYKYDFEDGSRLVVAEYPQRRNYGSVRESDEYYFHLMEKNKEGYGGKRYDEKYKNSSDCETYLVEFLKKIQKSETDKNPAI